MNKYIFKGRVAVSIVAAILLIILYSVIFSFSAQEGEETTGLSLKVSRKCVEIADMVTGQEWTEAYKSALAEYIHHPVRKLAHFTEYACMGMLVYAMWRPWRLRDKRLYLLVLLWVFLSAAGDEFHQTFVPDRSGNVLDVLLDTCGGFFGLGIAVFLERLVTRFQPVRKSRRDFEQHL